ncbi:hypothetical protein EZV61_11995 [Corallincola luteus]|uniref:KfrA N-terminal DNA-binding domain-containing protein n=1 Tax=Corallincola luteus TaxID=1775177 RepID=A0ABY2AJL6_9GAMM|nr:hypothetical protein [Corallincola luteus]TCI02997.1 hypothetical protein EZV61_11995 [Corallincola luteus]
MDNQLMRALQQLLQEGKVPSVALLKGRVGKQASMHELISAVQQAKTAPEKILAADTAPAPAASTAAQNSNAETSNSAEVLAELKAIRNELAWIRAHIEKQNESASDS